MTTGKKIALGILAILTLGGGGFLLYNKFGKKEDVQELMDETSAEELPASSGAGQIVSGSSASAPSSATATTQTGVRGALKGKDIDKIMESDVTVKSSPLPLKSGSIGRLVLITQRALRKLGAVDLNETGILDKPTILAYMNNFYNTTGAYQNNIKAIEKNQTEINKIDAEAQKIAQQIQKSPKTISLYSKTLNDLKAKKASLVKLDTDLRAKNAFKEISSSDYSALMNRHGGFKKLFAEAQQDAEFMKKWSKFSNA